MDPTGRRHTQITILTHVMTMPDTGCRAYFNVPTGTFVLGDLKSVLEDLVTHA